MAEDIALAFADAGGGSFTALDVARFAPEPGRITAISGPSGSGKSTLLYVLAGLLPPQRGTVRDDAVSIYQLREGRRDAWRRRRIGFIFQDFHLVPELSPLANASLPATFARAGGARQRAAALLGELGVPTARRSIELLSRGERQRVAIARALLFDPPVILADEPSASLDRAAATELTAVLRRLAKDGRTVVLASHDDTLLAAADRHWRLDHGKLRTAA
ncbi:MAG: ATP-binding cassette domain-containing protein [Bauldia sp.]|nr:ATP-binding cassette domain-containing protein [Bauldia sp.]